MPISAQKGTMRMVEGKIHNIQLSKGSLTHWFMNNLWIKGYIKMSLSE